MKYSCNALQCCLLLEGFQKFIHDKNVYQFVCCCLDIHVSCTWKRFKQTHENKSLLDWTRKHPCIKKLWYFPCLTQKIFSPLPSCYAFVVPFYIVDTCIIFWSTQLRFEACHSFSLLFETQGRWCRRRMRLWRCCNSKNNIFIWGSPLISSSGPPWPWLDHSSLLMLRISLLLLFSSPPLPSTVSFCPASSIAWNWSGLS